MYSAIVQSVSVCAGVDLMFGIGACKAVRTVEGWTGTHIKVIVVLEVEHSIDAGKRGNTDGAWRQSGIAIGVIGAVERHVIRS